MDIKALEDQVTKAANAVEAVQQRLDEVAGKADAIDLDVVKKAAEDAGQALQTVQEMKAGERFAAIEEELKTNTERMADLEATVVANGGGAESVKAALAGLNPDTPFAKFLSDRMGGGDPEARHAIAMYLRKGEQAPVPDEIVERTCRAFVQKHRFGLDEAAVENEVKSLVSGSGPDGGYFLTTDRQNRMIQRIFETSPLRGEADIVTTTTDVIEFVLDDDEAAAAWVGEIDARPATSTPKVAVLKIPVHEVYANPQATQRMLDDAGFDIEGWLSGKVSSRIGRLENTAFVNGDGSQKPRGFLTYSDWATAGVYERNKIERITSTGSGGAGTFVADDLITLLHTLKEAYQANAAYAMKRATFTTVMQLKTTDGMYLLNPMMLAQGAGNVLLGKRVVFMDDMPVAAGNALSIAIADWREGYTIVDRFDIRVIRDALTNKPYTGFYTTKRTGGAVTQFDAIKLLQLKNS